MNTHKSSGTLPCNFDFNSNQVRAVDVDGVAWFVASDIASALEYKDAHNLTRILDDDESAPHTMRIRSEDGTYQNRSLTLINESGLYHALFKSRKAIAVQFRKWVTSEVLPAIRKSGQYVAPTTITPAQKRSLINKVNQIANNTGRTHQSIWNQLNSKLQVATYSEIPTARFDDAMNYLNGVDSIAQVKAIAYQLDLPEAINIDTAHDVTGQLCVYLRKSNLENSTQITQAIEALYKWGVSQWSLIDHIANSTVMKRKGYTRI